MSYADGRVFDQIQDRIQELMAAYLGLRRCAHCPRLLPRISADDHDPVVRALGRLCPECYSRQETVRDEDGR